MFVRASWTRCICGRNERTGGLGSFDDTCLESVLNKISQNPAPVQACLLLLLLGLTEIVVRESSQNFCRKLKLRVVVSSLDAELQQNCDHFPSLATRSSDTSSSSVERPSVPLVFTPHTL